MSVHYIFLANNYKDKGTNRNMYVGIYVCTYVFMYMYYLQNS